MRALALALLALLLAASPAAADPSPFVIGTFAQIRSAHAGRAFVVHVWSLGCGPCLEELPSWGRFPGRHPSLPLVLINADRPGTQPARRIEGTLARAGLAGMPSYAFADRFEDKLRFQISTEWQGELPLTLLFPANGDPLVLTGIADQAAVETWARAQVDARRPATH